MNRTPDQLDQMLGEAWRMPYGRAQVAAVEEVIRHADAQGLAELQYAARILAKTAYIYAGEPQKAFVPFAWCLSVFDKGEGDPHYDHSLLWSFKSIVSALLSFPEVPLDQTLAVLDDMERRYRAAGHSMNPVHMCRARVARHIGDAATAAEQYRLWCAAPRGELSDCAGCEPTTKIRFLVDQGRHDEAVALARPVLDGQLTCHEQPASILTALLTPYARTGRLSEAADAHRVAYRQIRGQRADMGDVATHINFCANTGNVARAVELVQRHMSWLDEPPSPSAEMAFSASAALALRLAGDPGHAALAERALAIAARFDARNGTSRVGDQIRADLAGEPLAPELPLSVVRHAPRAVSVPRPVLPETAEDLVEYATKQGGLFNQAAADAAWARFDEILPEPTGVLAAQRLNARGLRSMLRGDAEAAESAWTEAIAAFDAEGDEVRAHRVRQRLGSLMCMTGRGEDGLVLVEESAAAVLAADGTVAQKCGALMQLANALAASDRDDDAITAARQADALAQDADAEVRADTALVLAKLIGPDAESRAYVDRAIELYTEVGASSAVAEAQGVLARLLAADGDFQAAIDALTAVAEDPSARARTQTLRASLALELDRPDIAADAYAEAASAFTAAGLAVPAAYASVDLANAALDADRPDRAADAAEDAIPVLAEVGDEVELHRAKYLLAMAHRSLDQPDHALPLLAEAADFYRSAEAWGALAQTCGVTADILDALDRDAEAGERYDQAADAFALSDHPVGELHNRRRAALSWHWAGDPRALTSLSAAESCAIDPDLPGARWELAVLGHDGARILTAAGRTEEAADRAVSAVAHFTALDATVQAGIAGTLHGRILLDLGRTAEAKTALESALAALPEDDPNREQVHELLATMGVS